MIENFNDVVEEYDEQDCKIEGHRNGKKFFRVDSACFPKLFAKLTSDESRYTYANAVIKQGFVSKKLSCLYKQLRFDVFGSEENKSEELIVNEVLSSQILNYFGVPTVYNIVCLNENEEGRKEYGLVSVDFLNADNEFKTYSELGREVPDGEIVFLPRNSSDIDEDDCMHDNRVKIY